MFEHIDAYPGDPILSLNENFQKDPRQDKINLSIGIYFDDEGRLPNVVPARLGGRVEVGSQLVGQSFDERQTFRDLSGLLGPQSAARMLAGAGGGPCRIPWSGSPTRLCRTGPSGCRRS